MLDTLFKTIAEYAIFLNMKHTFYRKEADFMDRLEKAYNNNLDLTY